MSAEDDRRRRHSNEFADGYSRAVRVLDDANDSGDDLDYINPFSAGTPQAEGFDQGWYDLTQK